MKIIMAHTAQFILSRFPTYFGDIAVEGKFTSSGIEYFIVREEIPYDDGVTNPY